MISDYGKRLNYAQVKIDTQAKKITQLKDSIQILQQLKAAPATIEQ